MRPDAPTSLPPWKRALDIACCLVAFPVFALLTLFMAVLLRLRSPGPILFRQERVGLRGQRFRIYKFRTMHVGSDIRSHQQHFQHLHETKAPMRKLDATDSRLIPLGWCLRATGLDELPQIVNVWRGEMTIVGPRPCIPYEYELYTPHQRARFVSAPGLTGLWQVSGKNRTTFDEMIRLDHEYSARRGFWLDVRIILLTVPALLVQLADIRHSRRAPAVAGLGEPPADPGLRGNP
ncbi:MAG: hypothetical protein RLZZ447_1876 [Verrucomicrobiota bacterium]|jgi:lipopolysaccharide/colanic/teichoic acid biosynthesis glycosyltransferase